MTAVTFEDMKYVSDREVWRIINYVSSRTYTMSVATAPKPVSTATRASLIEELHREPGKAEIIKGKVVRMSPAAWWHGQGSCAIYISLTEHKKKHGGGSGCADNVGFLVDLPDRYSFSPDAAWHTGLNE